MSNNLKNCSSLLEDERIKKELSNRYGSKRYWTFLKGIRFFLPVEYRNSSFPLSVIINDYLFDCMKQDVEPEGNTRVQRLKTFNPVKDAEQIVADINETNWSKSKKGRKLSFGEIQEEKRRYFCSKIKIKPEILICYILDHIDMFSSEVEIPSWLARLIDDVQGSVKNNERKNRENSDNKNSQFTFPGKQINSWDEFEIILVSHDMITIKTADGSNNFTFQQIGMGNKQNPEKPKKVWEALKLFAELNGKIPNPEFKNATLEEGKDRTAELNKIMKQFFNLPERIFKYNYKKHRCWETQFKISSKLYHSPDENTPYPQ